METQSTSRGEFRVQRQADSVCDAYVRRIRAVFTDAFPEGLPFALVEVGEQEFDIPLWLLPKGTVVGSTLRLAAQILRFPAAEDAARIEEEARAKAEEEARLKAETEAPRQAEEEARLKAETEAPRQAEEEARLKAETEAPRQVEEEARLKAETEARAKATTKRR